MQKVQDEFTDLNISSQRRYQLRNRKNGRCIQCGDPLKTKNHCEKHAATSTDIAKKYYQKKALNMKSIYKIEEAFGPVDKLPSFYVLSNTMGSNIISPSLDGIIKIIREREGDDVGLKLIVQVVGK